MLDSEGFEIVVDEKSTWVLKNKGDGKYELLTSDKQFDTVTLYNEGKQFVKLYTYDTSQIQKAKLVQRVKYDGIYVKNIGIRERGVKKPLQTKALVMIPPGVDTLAFMFNCIIGILN